VKKVFLSILLVIIGSFFVNGNNKESDVLKIISGLKDYNNIRIIVQIDVPNIKELTENSRHFKSGTSYSTLKKTSAKSVDKKLSLTINKNVYKFLHSLNGNSYTTNYIYKTLPYIAMSVNFQTLRKLSSLGAVKRVYLDKSSPLPKFYKKSTKTNNSLSSPLLKDSTNIIGADSAWNLGLTGKGWYVAILDTGLRTSHEMFKGKKIIEQCYSANGDCPNGEKSMSGVGAAAHYYEHSDVSGYDHGSHVTGVAVGNNGKDLYGVAKDANIIAVQVFSYFPSEDAVMSWDSDQLKGLEYVYSLRNSYKISSINMSLGGDTPYSSPCDNSVLKPAIDNLRAVGIATVIASGNEAFCNALSKPACISTAVSVDGSSKYDQEYSFGNWNNKMLDLIAPGSNIRSVVARDDSSYGVACGTSMAAPHVAGAWAILKQFNPHFTVDEILNKLKENGFQINQKSSCNNFTVTKPRIDLDTTVSKLFEILPPNELNVSKAVNESLTQTEYVNHLDWKTNPYNSDKSISMYKIYTSENNSLHYVASVNSSVFSYNHRNVGVYTSITYAITSVNEKGTESIPRYFTVNF